MKTKVTKLLLLSTIIIFCIFMLYESKDNDNSIEAQQSYWLYCPLGSKGKCNMPY